MSDSIDLATERADLFLAHALATAAKPPQSVEPCGECHNCGETIGDDMRWCDVACRDDWQSRLPKT